MRAGRELANLVAVKSKLLVDSGKPQDAADILLDMATFARDLMTNTPLRSSNFGFEIYRLILGHPFRKVLESGKLSKSELAALGKKLEIIDIEFPTLKSLFAFENLALGESILANKTFLEALDDTLFPTRRSSDLKSVV